MNELDSALQAITDARNELVAVVVHLNDTYLIDERPDRHLPGFPRIIATIRRLRAHIKEVIGSDRLLVVHSGDFLSPSLLAKKDRGKTMVELLNKAGVDYCLLGNHEFDKGADTLADRLREAKFTVLLANSIDPSGLIRQGGRVRSRVIWPEGDRNLPPLIALTGIVSADVHESFESPDPDPYIALVPPDKRKRQDWKWDFTAPNQALIEWLEDTKSLEQGTGKNILFRIVLSHATQHEDRLLRQQIPKTPRTYILGGHDHDIEWVEDDTEVHIMKNLANAETVRVMLLLAGGKSVAGDVYRAYERLQKRAGNRKLKYPADLEAAMLPASDLDREALKKRIANKKPANGFTDLESALLAAQFKPDIRTYKLRYDDHEVAHPDDIADVEEALEGVAQEDDGNRVCDLGSIIGPATKLEARDAYIRRRLTNFGVFVAECVRLEAGADIAIIQSGAFRYDSELKATLSVHDLRETFLYDDAGAIMVLEVDSRDIDALIEHGNQPFKHGTGAFPQIADERNGATGTVLLAISSYLLARKNNDGYDKVLQTLWNLAKPRDLHKEARHKSRRTFSIIEAVKARADAVKNDPPEAMSRKPAGHGQDDNTDKVIELLKTYVTTFNAESSGDPTGARSGQFRRWLGTDEKLEGWPATAAARDNVRTFLRNLPDIAAYPTRRKADAIGALSAAEEVLKSLQKSLLGHDFVFRDRIDYARVFDLAARGIPGWFPQSPG
jgi:2',3'-cyclic-nucleotide 2'-phosphodiesterase (5'-nucleotidase family)